MQALGIDMETIKSIVGHADLDMTRHYLHVQEPIRQAAVQKLSDAFASKPEKVWYVYYLPFEDIAVVGAAVGGTG